MLAIMERLVVPRFASLKQKRVTATGFRERIEAHHQARTELRTLADRVGVHAHDPVWRINSVIAAARADVGVTRENCAVQHQHVVTEHEHLAIHRRGIRQPTCARAFPAHGVGNVYRGLHLHFMGRMRRMGQM